MASHSKASSSAALPRPARVSRRWPAQSPTPPRRDLRESRLVLGLASGPARGEVREHRLSHRPDMVDVIGHALAFEAGDVKVAAVHLVDGAHLARGAWRRRRL